MAMPTSNNNVTVRKLVSVITSLWDKVKNAFLLKTSRGAANGIASLDANSKVPSSQLPDTALQPISIYNGYKELDFSNVTFETFISNVSVENSFSNKLFSGSLDSTNKCIRCLVRLHLSFNILNNLGVGEYPIAVVYMTRQVGTLMIFSNDSTSYCVRMQIYMRGELGSVHRFAPPSAVGSSSQPVFVNSDGSFSPCTNIPVIEHVTTIPVNPTVGTIYAL